MDAAARKAEELILTSPIIPGPYMQTITHSAYETPATILTQGVTNSSGLTDVKTLIDLDREQAIIVDTKENPIQIDDLEDFLETLVSAYAEASNAYKVQAEKIKKARNIKSLKDW